MLSYSVIAKSIEVGMMMAADSGFIAVVILLHLSVAFDTILMSIRHSFTPFSLSVGNSSVWLSASRVTAILIISPTHLGWARLSLPPAPVILVHALPPSNSHSPLICPPWGRGPLLFRPLWNPVWHSTFLFSYLTGILCVNLLSGCHLYTSHFLIVQSIWFIWANINDDSVLNSDYCHYWAGVIN